jgi:hypothetical protein
MIHKSEILKNKELNNNNNNLTNFFLGEREGEN